MKQTINKERYKKQLLVPEFSEQKQQKLQQSTVVIIGGGGLGSNSANLLARTGVGTIKIIDDDIIELSNLHRTSLFTEDDIGKTKSMILEEKLSMINSEITIKGINTKADKNNIEELVHKTDIILDGTDNIKTRLLINDASVKNNIPWVYSGVAGTIGMTMGIIPGKTPCIRCISQNISSSSNSDQGTFSILPSIVASIQCMETIKILLGEKPSGLIIYDIWKQCFEQMNIQKNPACSCCGKHSFEFLEE
ncbi:MAG: HesA/MoeB/ThiF family protein [Euryarchaeota archaeon]|nr:HesA/MoeB/ThiF family protein [Euryarchaeota archaeon]